MKTATGVCKCLIFLFSLLLLSSCLGVNADIVINSNGSGTIAIEYQASKSLDSLGKLDGNERWNTIAVGEADFMRTLDRLPDIKLLSFSSKEDAKNIITSVKMEFNTISGLLSFLDASGRQASFSGEAGSGRLVLTLNEAKQTNNEDFYKLVKGISDGYYFKMSFSFPDEGSLTLLNNQDKPLAAIPGSEFHDKGKKVSCSIPIYEVLNSTGGMKLVFQW